MRRLRTETWLVLSVAALLGAPGCGRSLEDEMRARAAAQAAIETADEAVAETPPAKAKQETADSKSASEPAAAPAVASPPVAPPAAAVAAEQPAAASIAPPPALPVEPLPPEQARERSLQNMEKIAAALLAYVDEKKSLPNSATIITRNETDVPLLSWRVTLLPYLGYEALYKQFRLNEAWNSPHNKKLLAHIPAEYQSPDRFDTSTNYLVPVGPQTAYAQGRGRVPQNFAAGAANVVMLIEADNTHVAPWTAPQDLIYDPSQPRTGFGSLRTDGALVALADGNVGRLPADLSDFQLRELFSIDEDSAPAGAFVQSAAATTPQPVAAADVPSMKSVSSAVSTSVAMTPAPASAPLAAVELPDLSQPAAIGSPVPEEAQLQAARTLLRDTYRNDYENAKSVPARRALVAKMLADAPMVAANPAEYYELLRVTRDMAVSAGLLDTALEAVRLLGERFALDGLALRAATLEEFSKLVRNPAEAEPLAVQSLLLIRDALEHDNFTAVQQAHDVYLTGLRVRGDRVELARSNELQAIIEAMHDAFAPVPGAIETLKVSPQDGKASETVGKYYCLVKHRWDEYLPLLAQCADLRLRVIATIELQADDKPETLLQLADQHWEMADNYPAPYNMGLKLRAAHHYSNAADSLTGGLNRIRAQKRTEEIRRQYGAVWGDGAAREKKQQLMAK